VFPTFHRLAGLLLACTLAAPAVAQDFYDPTVLRTIDIQFHDANWEQLLRANYVSETNIRADLTVEGVTYPNVGVRIRGNTSYTALPSGSQKFSLHVDVDDVNAGQDVMGYDDLNFNNAFRDPTFVREVVYNNFVARFIPNPRANNVVVRLNGANWGVYVNVQHVDKRMLRDYFANADGLRIKCSNNPNGPGLSYNGPVASGYTAYEVQADGGLADPIGALIAVANALSNEPLATWRNIDLKFAIDPSIQSVVLENLLTDDDSYVNKGCDFTTYLDPLDGRMHLQQRDANESFTNPTWAVTRNFTATNKPVLSRVLAVPELRQRYFAHYRRALRDLSVAYFEPLFTAQRDLISSAVQADPKKIYTYQNFLDNFTSTVNLAQPGLAGGNIIGLQQFVTQRAGNVAAVAELVASGPTIGAVQATPAEPDPAQPVHITATVAPAGSAVARVDLHYRTPPSTTYQVAQMLDDGASGDGAPGDGVFGVLLPVGGISGQRVQWYVSASASNSFASLSFLPEAAEAGPRLLDYYQGSNEGVRVTEFMYSGAGGEFIELSNLGPSPVDLTGWSLDDDHATSGAFSLSAFGVVQPGESVLVVESTAAAFRAAWNLAESVRIIDQFGTVGGNNLGRNDQIHVFNATGATEDRLYYGDQTYAGTIRTQNASGQTGCVNVGANAIASWQLSVAGDAYGSVASASNDVGTPGAYVGGDCGTGGFADGFEDP
jgi:hypothetical protein